MSGQAKSAQEHQNTLRWLGQVAGRYKLTVVGIALLDMVLGASSVAYALLFGNLVDRAAAGRVEGFLGEGARRGGGGAGRAIWREGRAVGRATPTPSSRGMPSAMYSDWL